MIASRHIAIVLLLLVPTVRADISPLPGLTLSGDLRERATYVSAIDFDEDAADTGWFWTQRIRMNADIGDNSGVHGRISLLSAIQEGIDNSPIQNNHLDIQEGYIVLPLGEADLKIGRQEIMLGSQRLLGTRDGTNVRRNWEGFRLTAPVNNWELETFGLQLVQVDSEGSFNDESLHERQLAGVYGTREFALGGLDLYYMYSDAKDRVTIEGQADQRRHSVGARLFGEYGSVFWNWEAILQGGRHGNDEIRAWTLATNTGYRLSGPWRPELMLSVNVASGDSDPDDGRLETFDALYPRGNYFSDLAQLGPANFFNVNPYLRLQPRDDLSLSLDVNFYWRLELEDGVYGPPGNLIRTPDGSRERFVNTAVSLSLTWEPNPHWQFAVSLAHSQPEAFIEATGPADTANFAEFTILARL
ncbi:MAG: alginate export family protein [Pseudomonadota bacterium]